MTTRLTLKHLMHCVGLFVDVFISYCCCSIDSLHDQNTIAS